MALAAVSICGVKAESLVATGLVTDAVSKSPVEGATVVVFNPKGEVVGTSVTNDAGEWAIPAAWDDCHLKKPSGGGGLFSSILGVITWPVRTVVKVVAPPAGAAVKSAARTAGGVAMAGVGVAAAAGAGPVAIAAAGSAANTVGRYAAGQMIGDEKPEQENGKSVPKSLSGQVMVRVCKPGHKDYSGSVGIYMLDRVQSGDDKPVTVAIGDPVKLASDESATISSAPREVGIFQQVVTEPAVVPGGSVVRVRARIQIPDEVIPSVWMVGKDLSTRKEFVLLPRKDGWWEAALEIPPKGPYRNHEITIAAYRTLDEHKKRDGEIEKRIGRAGAWDPEKPFPVDPAILMCRTRGYAVVTVTKPPKR